MITVFSNARIFDGVSEHLIEDGYVIIDGARIVEVGTGCGASIRDAERIDCGGRFLMPGLIDAHFHAYSPGFDIAASDRLSPQILALHARKVLEGALRRGFTTVRDAAGGDISLWRATEHGLIDGPRFFFSGKALSQTGGHGDMRPSDLVEPCGCTGYSGSLTEVVDGADAVRRAVREELRKGAHQIKIFVSGGGLSPTDPIWMPQFTDEEIRAAVYEAWTRRTYVMAHCHTDEGARRCVENGVRSIEHGTLIHSEETAALIAAKGAYVVPTLSVAHVLQQHADNLGISPASVEKIRGLSDQMYTSIELCERLGVSLGFGTDLLGHEYHVEQGGEFELRGRVSSTINVLRSATSINATLMGQSEDIGHIRPGAYADIIVMNGDPIRDLGLFRETANMPVVMKGGRFIRNTIHTAN